jgi:hypothetical protein
MEIEKWLKNLGEEWGTLTRRLAWIMAAASAVIFSPVEAVFGANSNAAASINAATVAVMVVLVCLTFLIAINYSQKKHTIYWAFAVVISLVLSCYVVFKNYEQTYTLICGCGTESSVRGRELAPGVSKAMPNAGCSDLCGLADKDTGKLDPRLLWTEDSVNAAKNRLLITYFASFALVSLTVIFVLQAIYCLRINNGHHGRHPSRTPR